MNNKLLAKIVIVVASILSMLPLRAEEPDAATIYGSVISSTLIDAGQIGLYLFDTDGGGQLSPVKIAPGIAAQGGGVYADHKYYSIHADDRTLYVYDTDTWEELESKPVTNVTLDMTYDATNGNIYGCFVDGGAQLGILNPETGGYEKIGGLSAILSALMCDADGKLYGISNSGMLYAIDKTTAEMTEIGDTYIFPYMAQSATIDPNTGKCYWAAFLPDFTSALYEVDLKTGNTNKLFAFPGAEEITGLFVMPKAKAGAPAKVTGLVADFKGGATSGSIKFTMPTTDNSGTALTASLGYKIAITGQADITGTANPGEEIEKQLTLGDGLNKIAVTTSNSVGESDRTVAMIWIGNDDPAAVDGLKIEKINASTLKLAWEKPTEGVHGGYIDTDAIRYRITRFPDNKVVAEAAAETSFIDNVAASELARYYYSVVAVTGSQESEPAVTEKILMGPAKAIPFNEDFATQEQYDLFTVVDENKDGKTWYYEPYAATAQYGGDNTEASDDWLISPPLDLRADSYYKVSFNAQCASDNMHRFALKLGNNPTPEAMTKELIAPMEVNTMFMPQPFDAKFFVAEDGEFFIGWQLLSDAQKLAFNIDDIRIERVASINAPAAATNFTVTAADKGALSATITFNAPASTIGGAPIPSLEKVEVYKGDALLKSFAAPAPGELLTCNDGNATNGFNTYKVVGYNSEGAGDDISVTEYVGVDIPGKVSNVTAEEQAYGTVKLTWEAPTRGINGGYVNPDDLTYSVKRNGWFEVGDGTNKTTATDEITDLNGLQRTVGYSVTAISAAGQGQEEYSPYISAGTPYEMPIKESFANGRSEYQEWTPFPVMGNNTWRTTNSAEAQDGDSGLIAYSSIDEVGGAEVTLKSPKFRIGNAVNPRLGFWVLNSQINDVMKVVIYGKNSSVLHEMPIDLSEATGMWEYYQLPLVDYKEENAAVQVGFVTDNVVMGDVLYLDNLQLTDDIDHNLAITGIKAPSKISSGDECSVTATVANLGKMPASGYSVELRSGERQLASSSGSEIAAGAEAEIQLAFVPGVTDIGNLEVQAFVDYDADQNVSNNQSGKAVIAVEQLPYPVVSDLSAEASGGLVELSWTAPNVGNLQPLATTDDFESYEPFTVANFGNWTMVDNDNNDYTMEFRTNSGQWITYPNSGYGVCFQVIDLSQVIATEADGWDSVSGNKFLICPNSNPSDNWLISPLLNPAAQTITINAKSLDYNRYGLETLTVAYSTTDATVESFKELASVADLPTQWGEYKFNLPEGTKYFAIRGKDINSALFIDDISYIPADSKPLELTVVGYNVYRDRQKVNTDLLAEPRFSDTGVAAGTQYTYAVTTVYDKGESDLSNAVEVTALGGVKGISNSNDAKITVKGNVISIESQEATDVAIYSTDGRTVYAAKKSTKSAVEVPSGCYIVKTGNKVAKVIVR